MQPNELAQRLVAWGRFWALKIARNRSRLLIYLLVALASALLISRLLGDSFDVSKQRLRGEPSPRRPTRQAEAQQQQPHQAEQQQQVDPFAARPRIETQNGHLILQAGPDKNIDFKTSGSRGTITLNGYKLDQLLGVAKAMDKTADKLNKRKMLKMRRDEDDETSTPAERYEMIIKSLLGSANKIEDLREQQDKLSADCASQTAETKKLRKQLAKRTKKLNQLQLDFETVLVKLREDNCRDGPSGRPICQNGATCLDQYDSYKCLCPDQWEGERCQLDVDECQRFKGTDLGCQNGAKCVNLAGGYKCECPIQFHGIHCTEQHNDCSLASSQAMCGHGKCVNLARSQANEPAFECICDQGWTTDGKSPACLIDVNECLAGQQLAVGLGVNASAGQQALAPGAYPCSQTPFVECLNLPGSFQCGPCPVGYQGNGRVCRDIDECQRDNGGCSRSPWVECVNLPGGRKCGPCPPGYQSQDDGATCLRVSACQRELNGGCDLMAKCVELAGVANPEAARLCVCQYPFVGQGVGPNGCTLFGQAASPIDFPPTVVVNGTSPVANAAIGQELVGQDFYMNQLDYNKLVATQNNATATGNKLAGPQDQCNPNPCLNGGECLRNEDTGFECICSSRWIGASCELPLEFGCGGSLPARSRGVFEFPLDGSYSKLISEAQQRDQLQAGASGDPSRIGPGSAPSQWRSFNCTWRLSTPMGSALRLEFSRLRASKPTSRVVVYTNSASNGSSEAAAQLSSSTLFELNHSSNCPERLDIRERLAEPLRPDLGRLLGRFCVLPTGGGGAPKAPGAKSNNVIQLDSESSSLELEYTVQGRPRPEPTLAFQLAWRRIEPPCGGPIPEADSGAVSSPRFPGFYAAGLECRYLLRVSAGKRIRVQVGELNLLRPVGSSSGECADSLTIIDGSLSFERPVLFRHCASSGNDSAHRANEPIISSSSTIEIVLLSSASSRPAWSAGKQRGGFHLTYEAEPSEPNCSGLYTRRSGQIWSSDYLESSSSANAGIDLSDDNSALALQFASYFDPREFATNVRLDQNPRNKTKPATTSDKPNRNKSTWELISEATILRCEYEIRPADLARNHHVQLDWIQMPTSLSSSSLGSLYWWQRALRCLSSRLLVFSGRPPVNMDEDNKLLLATFCAGDKFNASLSELKPVVSPGHVLYLIYEARQIPDAANSSSGNGGGGGAGQRRSSGFKLSYRTVCSATYLQPAGQIETELERDVPECVYHLKLPPNNSISLVVEPWLAWDQQQQQVDLMDVPRQQLASEQSLTLPDGSCIAQAVIMDGAVPQGDLSLAQAERQLKTFDFATTPPPSSDLADVVDGLPPDGATDGVGQAESPGTRVAGARDGAPRRILLLPASANRQTYWQYRSGQAHDIKEFDVCSLQGVGINSNWNEMSLMFRLNPKWIEQQQRQALDQTSDKLRQMKFVILYQSEAACGGIISEPSRGSIDLVPSTPSNSSSAGVRVGPKQSSGSSPASCAWILRNPQPNRVIQLGFDKLPLEEISGRRSAWIRWLRSGGGKTNSSSSGAAKSDADGGKSEAGLDSATNCSLVFQELIELHEPASGRTRLICPHELQLPFNWTTLSDTVHVRVLNVTGSATNTTTWPGRRPLAGFTKLKLNYTMQTIGVAQAQSKQAVVCGGLLMQASGTIRTPRYPFNYPADMDCVWILQAPQAEQQLRLNFSRFQLEESANCIFDYLEIRNGPSPDSPLMNRFCGQTLDSRLIIGQSNVLRLHLHTDTYSSGRGFSLQFDAASTGCGGTLTAESGQIDSPNYPYAYAHSADCEWLIEVSRFKRISLQLLDLNLLGDSDSSQGTKADTARKCRTGGFEAEFLEILELPGGGGGGKSLGRWCHLSQLTNGTKLHTSSNRLRVIYRSRAQDVGRGFRLSYAANCTYEHELTGLGGVLEAPAGSGGGGDLAAPCTWVVRAPLGGNLSVSITELTDLNKQEDDSWLRAANSRLLANKSADAPCANKWRAIRFWSGRPLANRSASLLERMKPLGRDFVAALTAMQLRPNPPTRYSNASQSVYELTQIRALCWRVQLDDEQHQQQDWRSFELTGDTNLLVVSQLDANLGFRLEWRAKTSCGSQLQGDAKGETLLMDGIHFDERLNLSSRALQQPIECLWLVSSEAAKSGGGGGLELEMSADMRQLDSDSARLASVSRDGSLELASSCNESSLQVFDGPHLSSPTVYENCQSVSRDETLLVTSGQALVRFFSAGSVARVANRSVVPGQSGRNFMLYGLSFRSLACSRSQYNIRTPFGQPAGTRSSPNYPDLYEATRARCSLVVASERNQGRMRVFVDELDIPIDQRGDNPAGGQDELEGADEGGGGFASPDDCTKSGSFLSLRETSFGSSLDSSGRIYCGRFDRKSSVPTQQAGQSLERSVFVSESSGVELDFHTTGVSRGRWKLSYERLCGSAVNVAWAAEELSTPNYPQRPVWPDSSGMSEQVCVWRISSSSWLPSSASNRQLRIHFNLLDLIGAQDQAGADLDDDRTQQLDRQLRPPAASAQADCLRVYEGYNISLRQSAFNLTRMDTELKAKVRICSVADLKYSSMRYTSFGSELVVVTSGRLIAKFLVHAFENHCGGEYQMDGGEFASPNFPQPHGPDLDCHYFILGSPGSRIELTFEQFGIGSERRPVEAGGGGGSSSGGATSKCDDSADYVEIRQLSSSTRTEFILKEYYKLRYYDLKPGSSLLENFLAKKHLNPPNASLATDDWLNKTQMGLRWRSLERIIELAHLHWLLVDSGDETRVRSKVVGQNSRSALDLEEFYAGSKLIGRFCNNFRFALDRSQVLQDEILVRLRTSSSRADSPEPVTRASSKQLRGFLASYKIRYGGQLRLSPSSSWGLLSSPHFPEHRRLNTTISWYVEGPLNERIEFELISMNLGSARSDCQDTVRIYDGLKPAGGSPLLGSLCGHLSFKGLLMSRMSPLWAAAIEAKVSPRKLPTNSAFDPYVRASLLRRFRSSSNVASVVYRNEQNSGAFLMRYRLIQALDGDQEVGLNETTATTTATNSTTRQLELELLDQPISLDEALEEQFEPSAALDQDETLDGGRPNATAPDRSCSKVFHLSPRRTLSPATGANSNTNDTVQLASPNWPQEVRERSLDCHWLLTTNENTNIVLQVAPARSSSAAAASSPATRFGMPRRNGNNERCLRGRGGTSERNFVVVHDGATKLAPIITRLCLPAAPIQLESTGRQMFIRYVHEARSLQAQALESSASPDNNNNNNNPDDTMPQDDSTGSGSSSLFWARAQVGRCGGQYHVNYMAKITDRPMEKPHQSANYENNLDCFYYVFASMPEHKLTISSHMSKLELAPTPTNANCTVGDYIELRDLPISSQHFDYSPEAIQRGRSLGRFCAGRPLPGGGQLETPNSAISIRFHTDSEATGRGFSLMVLITSGDSSLSCPRQAIKLAEGDYIRLISPGWPHGAAPQRPLKPCRYLISAPPDRSLKLTFVDLRRATASTASGSNGSVTCRDSLSYLDDQEASSLAYSQRPLQELVAPLSGSKLRQLVKTVPCKASANKMAPPKQLTTTSSQGDSKTVAPLVEEITIESYYEWLLYMLNADGTFKQKFQRIETNSQHLMLEYSAESLQQNEGFVALVRVDDRRATRACGGDVRPRAGENLLESANFGKQMQESDAHIQCTWRLVYDSSLSRPFEPPGAVKDRPQLEVFPISFLVFAVFELPPLVQNTTYMKEVYSSYTDSDWSELCGLNRLVLSDADDSQLTRAVVSCGYASNNGIGWAIVNRLELNQVMVRTKNLEQVVYGRWPDSEQPNRMEGRRKLFRGLRAYFHESSCLQKRKTAFNTYVIKSHPGLELPGGGGGSYKPSICQWSFNLEAGHFELVFKMLNLRLPETTGQGNSSRWNAATRRPTSSANDTVCFTADGGRDLMDYVEISLGNEPDGEILARLCAPNQHEAQKHNLVLNATSELVISFMAGIKQLAEGKYEFPTTSAPTGNEAGGGGKTPFGFELELVKVKNSSISDFCKRERRSSSIYSMIRNRERAAAYHLFDFVTPSFLYPKNVHCSLDLTIDENYKFNFTFVSLFDMEPSLNCKNDYVELYDLVERNETTTSTTIKPRPKSGPKPTQARKSTTTTTTTTSKPQVKTTTPTQATKTSTISSVTPKKSISVYERFNLNLHRELEPRLIGRWCGRDLPKGTFNSASNKVRVVFHSNEHVEGKGFILEWSAQPAQNTTRSDTDLEYD